MPKRKTPADPAQSRRAVVAARIVPAGGPNPSAGGAGSNWGSLLSGLPQDPNDEDHEEWVERLFGNERQGSTSPLHSSALLGGDPGMGVHQIQAPPSKGGPRSGNTGGRRRGGAAAAPPAALNAQQPHLAQDGDAPNVRTVPRSPSPPRP